MTTDEKGVFIQKQSTIVSSKVLVLGICLNTFVHDCGLTWPQDIMPASMPALQYRHEAPLQLVAEAPHPMVHTGGGYYPRLASTFPAPRLRPSRVYCLLLRTKALTLDSVKSVNLTLR